MQHFLLTIDVEDWFQVENFRDVYPHPTWDSCELRVEGNTHRLLDLLDSIEVDPFQQATQNVNHVSQDEHFEYSVSAPGTRNPQPATRNPKATFFILGWLAKRLPNMVREIQARGHEVASHGETHELCSSLPLSELRRDLESSKKRLEDITGRPVWGYRAPSFSVSRDILELIRQAGYRYDSSYNSFSGHARYGKLDFSGYPLNGDVAIQLHRGFFELPISNLTLGGRTLPWGGGGYFRLLPLPLYQAGLKRVSSGQKAFVFYMHPWEIDPEQPKVRTSRGKRFRHYVNLKRTEKKLSSMLQSFAHCAFPTCSQYLAKTFELNAFLDCRASLRAGGKKKEKS